MENNTEVPQELQDPSPRQTDQFDFTSLPPDIQTAYGSEKRFNSLVAEWINKQQEEERRKVDYEVSHIPKLPETDQFSKEIQDPEMVETYIKKGVWKFAKKTDPQSLAVYRLNRDKQGPPVVINMSWSVGADTRAGRPILKSLAEQLDRPIVIIDALATGKSDTPNTEDARNITFDSLAERDLQALKHVIKTFPEKGIDIVGISMGGLRAIEQAKLLGDKVRSVTTVCTPGFNRKNPLAFAYGLLGKETKNWEKLKEKDEYGISKDVAYYEQPSKFGPPGVHFNPAGLPGHWQIALNTLNRIKSLTAGMEPEQFTAERMPFYIRFGMMMTKNVMKGNVDKLSPRTKWNDILGSDDAITDYQDHIAAVRKRNASPFRLQAPTGKSQIQIVGGFNHAWTTQHTQMATTIGTLLRK